MWALVPEVMVVMVGIVKGLWLGCHPCNRVPIVREGLEMHEQFPQSHGERSGFASAFVPHWSRHRLAVARE